MDEQDRAPHSADHLNASERDFWWNADFIALLARRCRLAEATAVLDVGCGAGHWIRTLLPELTSATTIAGVEPDLRWLERARALTAGVAFRQGTAEAIPFPDASFDLVTCQTVLIHVCDPAIALAEMLRVLRPGGTLLLAEPSNLAAALVFDSTPLSFEDRIRLAELQGRCELGKQALGEGFNSVGDLLPGLVAQLGVTGVRVYQSDRASALVPPYAEPDQQALVAQWRDLAAREVWIWDRADTLRYFVAGGGAAEDFEPRWSLAVAATAGIVRAIDEQRYHTAGGGPHYLIVATKA